MNRTSCILFTMAIAAAGCSSSDDATRDDSTMRGITGEPTADTGDATTGEPTSEPTTVPTTEKPEPQLTPEAAAELAAAQTSSDAAIKAVDSFIQANAADKDDAGWRLSLAKPPQVTFDASKAYVWNLKTNQGAIRVELMPDVAPMHVSSTIYLTRLGYYDGLGFHRVIPDFMAQGGCPNTAVGAAGRPGTGGPGYQYSGQYDPNVRHGQGGLLSMANAGEGTDGSQFFLTFKPTAWLDGKHTIFGKVAGAESFATLQKFESFGSRSGATSADLRIESATITIE